MPRALDTSGLPIILAMTLWPWIDAIEAARPEMADALRETAEEASRDLRRTVVVTAPLETMLGDALCASDKLARHTAKPVSVVATARMDALLALNDLIAWLRRAKPSEWSRTKGVGW